MRHFACTVSVLGALLGAGSVACAADRVPKSTRDALRRLARQAAELPAPRAIERYEEALSGSLKGYGRAHLQVAELYIQDKRWPEAAFHFRACMRDRRVDRIDRDLVCKGGFKEATAPISGLPPDATAEVLAPEAFAGPVRNGDRLPRGPARIEVTDANGVQTARIMVDDAARWVAPVRVPDAFITPVERKEVPDGFIAAVEDPVEPAPVALRWPAYVAGAVGFVAVGTGLALGLTGRSQLESLRDDQGMGSSSVRDRHDLADLENQAVLADGLIFGGAALMAGAVALWFIFDGEDPPAESAPAPVDAPNRDAADDDGAADEDDADDDADETLDEGDDLGDEESR